MQTLFWASKFIFPIFFTCPQFPLNWILVNAEIHQAGQPSTVKIILSLIALLIGTAAMLLNCIINAKLWNYTEQMLLWVKWMWLLAKLIIQCFLSVQTLAKKSRQFSSFWWSFWKRLWWIRLKGLKLDTFLFSQTLTNFFKFHLERKRKVLCFRKFAEKRWVRVGKMTCRPENTARRKHLPLISG